MQATSHLTVIPMLSQILAQGSFGVPFLKVLRISNNLKPIGYELTLKLGPIRPVEA
jgi:hypothetical protein